MVLDILPKILDNRNQAFSIHAANFGTKKAIETKTAMGNKSHQ